MQEQYLEAWVVVPRLVSIPKVLSLSEALKDQDGNVSQFAEKTLAKIEAAHPGSTTSKQKDSSNAETLKAGSAEPTQKANDRDQ
ncbi:MAG: hypothetical protein HY072_07045 [Deltaproteobacteria bacterium]|nr:hypothetical protein [Deltaproteobacteria bacterium]